MHYARVGRRAGAGVVVAEGVEVDEEAGGGGVVVRHGAREVVCGAGVCDLVSCGWHLEGRAGFMGCRGVKEG